MLLNLSFVRKPECKYCERHHSLNHSSCWRTLLPLLQREISVSQFSVAKKKKLRTRSSLSTGRKEHKKQLKWRTPETWIWMSIRRRSLRRPKMDLISTLTTWPCLFSAPVTSNHKKRKFHPEQSYSRLHSLAVAGHVHLQVIRIIQHFDSKQVVLQVTPQLCKLEQLAVVEYGPAGRKRHRRETF